MRRNAQATARIWIARSSHTRAEVCGSATRIVLSGGVWFIHPLPTLPRMRGRVGRGARSQMSNLPANQKMIEGIETAAVNKEIERRDRPHQGVFEAECIPEIAAHPPALDVRHREKNKNRHCRRAGGKAKREQRPEHQFGHRYCRRPQPARAVAGLVELRGQRFQAIDPEAGAGEPAEGHAQAMRNEREADNDAKQRRCGRSKRPVGVGKLWSDERCRIRHCYSLISPRLTLTPSRVSMVFVARPFASISTV